MENKTLEFNKLDRNALISLFDKERNPNFVNEVEIQTEARNLVNELRSILDDNNLTGEFSDNLDILDSYINNNGPNEYITNIDEDLQNQIIDKYNRLIDKISDMQNFIK